MPYFIETFDKPGHQAVRQQHRQTHLDYLEEKKSLLLACGAKLTEEGGDAGGGIYIVDVDSYGEAESFIHNDPFYADANLFEKIVITRWRKAYLDGNCYLT